MLFSQVMLLSALEATVQPRLGKLSSSKFCSKITPGLPLETLKRASIVCEPVTFSNV